MSTSVSALSIILPAALLVLCGVAFIYGVRMFMLRQSTPGPQKSRQAARIALGPVILGLAIMLFMGQINPEKRTLALVMSVPLIVIALRFGWLVLHEPTEAEAIENFAHDREHCGRCGYSVTGNVTGTCSECGWTFPTQELQAEEADWSAWWRKWHIHYVRHYVWHLSSYIGLGLYCFALAAMFCSQGRRPSAIVIGLLGVHLSINAIRVIEYLMRRKRAIA